jgi:hypothetical protein
LTDVKNLVLELSNTTGTGNFTLINSTGWQNFNDAFSTGGSDVFFYFIRHTTATEWEVGTGHLSDSSTLVRDTIIANSNGDTSPVNFSSGSKQIINDIAADRQFIQDSNTPINFDPGSDTDQDIITMEVTGNPTFSWDEGNDAFKFDKSLLISATGDGQVTYTVGGASIESAAQIYTEGSGQLGGMTVMRHSNTGVFAGHFIGLRADGTFASPGLVDDGDTLARFISGGYDGSDYEFAAEIRMRVDGTAAADVMPGEIAFFVNAGSQTLIEVARFRATGNLELDQSLEVTGDLTVDDTSVLKKLDTVTISADTDYDKDTPNGS